MFACIPLATMKVISTTKASRFSSMSAFRDRIESSLELQQRLDSYMSLKVL